MWRQASFLWVFNRITANKINPTNMVLVSWKGANSCYSKGLSTTLFSLNPTRLAWAATVFDLHERTSPFLNWICNGEAVKTAWNCVLNLIYERSLVKWWNIPKIGVVLNVKTRGMWRDGGEDCRAGEGTLLLNHLLLGGEETRIWRCLEQSGGEGVGANGCTLA